MPAELLQTDAFVLLKRPPVDAYQGFTVLSARHGALLVFQRVAKKSAPNTVTLDLFDEAALLLESSNQGRTWFIREVRLIRRHPGIGRSYEALQRASALASLVARNTVDAEGRGAVTEMLRGAFAAFETSDRPDIVYFKCVYRFARDEGYPMKQQWFPTLPSADRTEVATLLNRPLAEQSTPPPTVARLQRRLDDYLRGHTEILLE